MDNLKPCPFCGGKAKYKYQMPYNAVQCTKYKVFGATVVDSYEHRDGKEKAIEAWNRRVTMENEKRLIDANAFLKDILTAGIGKTIIEYSESDIGYMIRKRPTVDAVEVVRCNDCKFGRAPNRKDPMERHYIDGIVVCTCADFMGDEPKGLMPEDFCSYGERKEQ